jgi:hypothetical protein
VKKAVEASPSPAAAKGAAAAATAPAVNNTATSSDLLGLAVDSQHQQQSLGILALASFSLNPQSFGLKLRGRAVLLVIFTI